MDYYTNDYGNLNPLELIRSRKDNIYDELNVKDDHGHPVFLKEIVDQAYQIYLKMKPRNHRKRSRIKLNFILIYYAYNELHMPLPQNKYHLGHFFGLDDREIDRSFIEFSSYQTGYVPPHHVLTVDDYLHDYNNRLKWDDNLSALQRFIGNKCPELSDIIAIEYYAAALISLYREINYGNSFSKSIANTLNLDEALLIQSLKQMRFIYNNNRDTIVNNIVVIPSPSS
jgi:hypothetical protein